MGAESAADLAGMFSSSDFATAGTVGAVTVYGYFDNPGADAMEMSGSRPTFLIKTSDVTTASIARASTVTISSVAYVVRDIRANEDGAVTLLVLESP